MDSSILLQATFCISNTDNYSTIIFNTSSQTSTGNDYPYSYFSTAYASSDIHIDYGDGQFTTLSKGDKVAISHKYTDGIYTVTVRGAPLIYKVAAGKLIKNVACNILSTYKRWHQLEFSFAGGYNVTAPTHVYQLYLGPGLFGQYYDMPDAIFYLNCCLNAVQNIFYPRSNLPKCVILEDDKNTYLGATSGYIYSIPATFTGILPPFFEKQLPYLGGNSNYPKRIGGNHPIAASTDFISNRQLKFDNTGQSDLIGPKLNGSSVGDMVNTYTHTYTTFPNKTLKKVLGIGGFGSALDIYGAVNKITFDDATHTLTVPASLGGSDGDERTVHSWVGLKFIFEDDTFDCDYFYANGYYHTCLLEGTQIKTFDGQKDIQNVVYSDLILVYDFFRGKLCYQFPSFIHQDTCPIEYVELHLNDNSVIRVSGSHDFYNAHLNRHTQLSVKDFKSGKVDLSCWQFMQLQPDGSLLNIGIKTFNIINAATKAHSLYTSGTQTYFANNILCSNRDFNLFGETLDNRLNLDRFKYVNANIKLSMEDFEKEFGKISSTVYYGQNQHILYNGARMGLSAGYEDLIKSEYESYDESAARGVHCLWSNPKELPNVDGYEACYIALMDNDKVLSKDLYKVGEVIDLPKSDKGWYCVADTNIYFDKYEIKTNTVLEKVV